MERRVAKRICTDTRDPCKSIPSTQLETPPRTCAWPLTTLADCRRWMQRILLRLAFLRGGLATVALTPNAPPGLIAAINFAGGTDSRADHDVPNAGEVIGAYRDFGKTARIPNFGSMPRTTSTSGPSLHKSLTRHFVPRAA